MNRTIARLFIALALLLGTAACGGGEETGTGVGVNAEGGDDAKIGESTTTTAAAVVATTAPPTTAPPKATTTAPPTTAPPAQNVIKIIDDRQGASFVDPPQYQIKRGSTVTWQNTSSKPRKIAAENNAFVSPEIAPGASWSWKATAPAAVYNYRDTTRPYAVAAQLQVY